MCLKESRQYAAVRYLGAVLQSVAGCQRVRTTSYSGFGHSCYIFSVELIGCVVMED